MSIDAADRDFVRSLSRGLSVIECFDAESPAATLSEVAQRTGLSRGTAARILKTLECLGYVRSDGRMFMLQPRTLKLGHAYLSSQPMWRYAQPTLRAVAEQTGALASLAVIDRFELVYWCWSDATRIAWDLTGLGGRLPAHPAAMGRVLLAGMPDDAVIRFLANCKLERRTPKTVLNPARLLRIIAAARRNGYSLQCEETEMGYRAVAVPVLDASGGVIASLGVRAPVDQYTMRSLIDGVVPILRREAHKLALSPAFGGTPPD